MDYKIANTTKSQRVEIIKNAFEISIIGNEKAPSSNARNILQEYIDGVTELEDVQKKILDLYKTGE